MGELHEHWNYSIWCVHRMGLIRTDHDTMVKDIILTFRITAKCNAPKDLLLIELQGHYTDKVVMSTMAITEADVKPPASFRGM